MEINSNLVVKNETEEYDADNESQNYFNVKKEIVKNEEHEIEISEVKLQANCKDDFIDDNLDVYKKVKTESQHKELSSDPLDDGQSVVEFPENCEVDEKVDISEVTLRSTEYNHYRNVTIDSEDDNENPRIFAWKQSNSERLQQEEEINIDSKELIISKIHTCKICSYQATNETVLNMHITSVHKNNGQKIKINCVFCGKSFRAKIMRDDHVLKNHKDKTCFIKSKIHTCTFCSYQTTFKSSLNAHIDSVHNEHKIKIRCEFCDKTFTTKQKRDDHVLKNHKDKTCLIKSKIHTCTICSYQTTCKSILNAHIDSIHNEQKIKMRCEFCDKFFSTKQNRDDHVLKKHKDKTSLIESKIHTCTICSFQTTYKYILDTHIDSIHNEQKIKIMCEFCNKSFTAKQKRDDHILKNHKDKSSIIKSKIHTCTVCSYQTTYKYNLDTHIYSVHNDQKIKIGCEFCDKSFLTKRMYDYHVLRNHKDKTSLIKDTIYSCTICPYQTTSNFSLNRHIILTHNKLNKE